MIETAELYEGDENIRPAAVPDLTFLPRSGGYASGHETRTRILLAAFNILVEHGLAAISLRRIAAACNLKPGNLNYHFPSREDLLRELFEAVVRSYEIEFESIMRTPGLCAEERLSNICSLIVRDISSKKTTRIFPELWALANHDAFVRELVQELYARARAPLLEIIGELRPDLSPDQQSDLAVFIVASMEGMTIFLGHGRHFQGRLLSIESIAISCFNWIIKATNPD